MRIADSNITMTANRRYQQTGTRSGKGGGSEKLFGSTQGQLESSSSRTFYSASQSDLFFSNYGKSGQLYFNLRDGIKLENLSADQRTKTGGVTGAEAAGTNSPAASKTQNAILSGLLQRFMSAGMFGKPIYTGITQRMVTYSEAEDTSFSATGRATTEDGRTIDFNVDILMSRSFMEYSDVQIPVLTDSLTDPLMINVGADTVQISDQKFRFDLDADGVEEEISMPGRGSGFLALDINGDGIINDGSELFGTKSGDGFADLARYDSDGNGWIDENDEVFDRLKVWCKGENGEDILMSLKEADVGAIFLGEQGTEFTLEGQNGQRSGVVRSTGIFLRESGGVGTVQHVDLAVAAEGTQTGGAASGVQAGQTSTGGAASEATSASQTASESDAGTGEKELEEKLDELLKDRDRSQTGRSQTGRSREAENRRTRQLARRRAEAKRAAVKKEEKRRMEQRLADRRALRRRRGAYI